MTDPPQDFDERFSLSQQIEEVKREIALREKVYPNMVRKGQMRESIANYHLDRMRAVLTTLEKLAAEMNHGQS